MGKYTFNAYSLILFFWECQFCIFLFMLRHKKRKYFILRYVACILTGTLATFGLAVVNTELSNNVPLLTRVLCYSAVSSLNLAVLFICYKEHVSEILLCWCCGTATYQIANKFFPLLQNIAGIDDKTTISLFNASSVEWYDWPIFFFFHLAVQLALAIIFSRKDFLSVDKQSTRNVVIVSLVILSLINTLTCIARVYENESMILNMVVKTFTIGFGITMLIISKYIFIQNRQKQEMSVIKELWRQEKMQFKSIKANIEFINSKCHDLKKVFSKFEGKMDSSEIEEIKQAMEFYDKTIKTGNDILDVVLCEKIVLCDGYGIQLSCLADGSKLDMLSVSQTYSLFSNVIDNAITALRKIEDKEKRIITLTVRNTDEGVEIEEYNYFEDELTIIDGLPQTIKEDKALHGYGMKSMRYIAENHGGTLSVSADDNIFTVLIKLPYANEIT